MGTHLKALVLVGGVPVRLLLPLSSPRARSPLGPNPRLELVRADIMLGPPSPVLLLGFRVLRAPSLLRSSVPTRLCIVSTGGWL